MKRIGILLWVFIMLSGCAVRPAEMDRAMNLRSKLLSNSVSFDAEITADYGDTTYAFEIQCSTDTQGNLRFTVTKPEVISGITGTVSTNVGRLTFDDTALAFDLMADGQLSPVSAPWILMRALRSGYLTSCAAEGDLLRIAVDDSYEEDALHLDVWLNEADIPTQSEIFWKGRRLLTIIVKNFTFS